MSVGITLHPDVDGGYSAKGRIADISTKKDDPYIEFTILTGGSSCSIFIKSPEEARQIAQVLTEQAFALVDAKLGVPLVG